MELGDMQRAALAAILGAGSAWVQWRTLKANGHGPALCQLEGQQYVARWDRDRAGRPFRRGWEAVTLTPLAAHRLRVVLVERRGRPIWAPDDDQDGPPPVELPPWRIGRARVRQLPHPELIEDHRERGAGLVQEDYVDEDGRTKQRPMTIMGQTVAIDPRL